MVNNTATRPLRSATAYETPAAVPAHYRRVKEEVNRAVLDRESVPFSLQDIAPFDTWATLIRSESSHYLVAGAFSGALDALRTLVALPLDVERCPVTPLGGATTTRDMALARSWLVEGLKSAKNPHGEMTKVAYALAARGWLNDATRITSLILAIYSIARCAGTHTRAQAR